MQANGTARRFESPWSSALHMVPKKDEGWSPCGDYRALNTRTIPDRYPVRLMSDFSHQLAGCTVFSTHDLVNAYNQIHVNKADIPKTAITTPFGLFEFPFMSFGLRNAAQTFQRFIDEVLRDLDFCFPYIDDILVASATSEEQEKHLRIVFQRLADYGILLNVAKCIFAASKVPFVGYHVSATGIRPLEDRVKAVQDYTPPRIIKQLRRFLGMLNFYHRFLPYAATDQAPLNALLSGPKIPGIRPVNLTPELQEAFANCKSALAASALLAHPHPDAPLALCTDASDFAMSAALQQQVDGAWQPLAFFSKKLSPAQQKYSPYDRELLAIYSAIRCTSATCLSPGISSSSQTTSPSHLLFNNGVTTVRPANSVTSTSLPSSRPTSGTSPTNTTSWLMRSPELRRSSNLLIFQPWSRNKRVMLNSKTSSLMALNSAWRKSPSPAVTFQCIATSQHHVNVLTSPHPSSARFLILSMG
jgi:hypothetical protein